MPDLHYHLLVAPKPEHLDYLRGKLDADIQLTTGDDVPENVEVLVAGRPKREHIQDRKYLQSLIVPFAGIPQETRELMLEFRRITVHNLHHNAPIVAESAIALLLAAAKSLVPVDRVFRQHNWTPRYVPAPHIVLEGKTALIVGYGTVGRHVGRVLWAFGMTILAVRRHVAARASTLVEQGKPDKLREWLPRADFVVMCLPDTPETRGMIGAQELALLPKGAVLVNVGRADSVDAGALYQALKDGHLGAAGIDVWYHYPNDEASRTHTPPADYPFHELDNIVMSPHRAGGGGIHEVELRRMDALAESLNAAARGQPIPHRVDLKAGY